jgi:FRG domain-containing protein
LDFSAFRDAGALWRQAAEELADHYLPGVPAEAKVALAGGLLQHYGFQTHFVDVSQDPNVALRFALMQYRDLFPVIEEDPKHPKLTRLAWYEGSTEPHGFLYVFDQPIGNPREQARSRPRPAGRCRGHRAALLRSLCRGGLIGLS